MQTICLKCNSKWETAANVEKCPFCGALLNIDQEIFILTASVTRSNTSCPREALKSSQIPTE